MISIIIPFYNRADLVHARMNDLFRHSPDGCEIILVDDASTENDCAGIIAFWQKNTSKHTIRYKRLEKNGGFIKACNYGASKAKGDIIILLSDDVSISGDVFGIIENILKADQRALVGARLIDWDSGWNTFPVNGSKHICAYLEGFLLACTKETWNELGGFDELYCPNDMEDVDLSTQAKHQGRQLIAISVPFLSHISGATINAVNPRRMELTQRNKQRFIEKWKSILESGSKPNGERGNA